MQSHARSLGNKPCQQIVPANNEGIEISEEEMSERNQTNCDKDVRQSSESGLQQ